MQRTIKAEEKDAIADLALIIHASRDEFAAKYGIPEATYQRANDALGGEAGIFWHQKSHREYTAVYMVDTPSGPWVRVQQNCKNYFYRVYLKPETIAEYIARTQIEVRPFHALSIFTPNNVHRSEAMQVGIMQQRNEYVRQDEQMEFLWEILDRQSHTMRVFVSAEWMVEEYNLKKPEVA